MTTLAVESIRERRMRLRAGLDDVVAPFVLPVCALAGAACVAGALGESIRADPTNKTAMVAFGLFTGTVILGTVLGWKLAKSPRRYANAVLLVAGLGTMLLLRVDASLTPGTTDELATSADAIVIVLGAAGVMLSWPAVLALCAAWLLLFGGSVLGAWHELDAITTVFTAFGALPIALGIHAARYSMESALIESRRRLERSHDELRHANDAMAKLNTNLVDAENAAHMGSVNVDLTNDAKEWSPGLYTLMARDVALGPATRAELEERIQLDDRPAFEKHVAAARSGGPPDDVTVRLARWDGAHVSIRMRARRTLNVATQHPVLVFNLQDVTSEIALERELEDARRLAAIGALAAGLAHEVNNPLMYAKGSLELAGLTIDSRLAETDAGPDERALLEHVRHDIDLANRGATRIARIVEGLQQATAAGIERVAPYPPRAAIERGVARAAALLGERLVETHLDATSPITAPSMVVEQAVYEIVKNAIEAQRARGTTEPVSVALRNETGRVVVEVRDHGGGISAEDRSRMFTPFFTRRGQDEGVGLALSIARTRIRAQGGNITFTSTPLGATFAIELPAALT